MYYDQKESGKRIAALRKEKGLTQEQLAEKLNISTSTLEVGIDDQKPRRTRYATERRT